MITEAIYNALISDPTLSVKLAAGAGFNVYPHFVPDDFITQYNNFVTYSRVSKVIDPQTLVNYDTFQINAIAKTYDNVQVLANDIINVLNTFYGNLGGFEMIERSYNTNIIETYDKDTHFYFMPIEFKFIYK